MAIAADVMVLCAGLGMRLRPLTLELPKPAVPLLNRPLISYALGGVKQSAGTRVVINTHWLPEKMAEVAMAECARLGLELAVSHEPILLGSGGGLWQARARGLIARDRPLLVLNGDVLTNVNLGAVVDAHVRSGAAATMVLRPMLPGGYTPIEADEHEVIRRIGQYGKSISHEGLLFTGTHVLSPEALDLLPPGESSIVAAVYARLLDRGAVHAYIDDVPWLDLGTTNGYLDAHTERLAGKSLVAETAQVDASAVLQESCAGARATVGANSVLRQCIVWPDANLPAGTQLERAVVTPRGIVKIA